MGRKIRKELRAVSFELRAISKGALEGSQLVAQSSRLAVFPNCEMIIGLSTCLSPIFVLCLHLTLNCKYGLFVIN